MTPVTDPSSSQERPIAVVVQGLLRELWRYKWVVPAVAILVAGAVAFYTMRQPRIYEATATLEYDPHPARPLGRAVEDTSAAEYSYWNTYEFYETQNYILKSRGLAERVVRQLGLHKDSDFNGVPSRNAKDFPGVPVEHAARKLSDQLRVHHLRDTRIVRLTVRDPDPDRAELLANAFAEAYIDKSLEDRLASSALALEWLAGQMDTLKEELESSELALYRYREENKSLSSSLEQRQKIIASKLEHYSNTLTELHTKRVLTDARLDVLRDALTRDPSEVLVEAGPLGDSEAINSLRTEHNEAMTDLDALSVTYGPAHPLVRTAQAKATTIGKQLRNQVESIVLGVEADLQELAQAEAGIQQKLQEANAEGLELSLQEIEYVRLERKRQSKSDLYALVMQRAAETDLTRALRVANARIVDRALKPTFAVSPKVRSAVIVGSVLGLILGILVALGVSQLDSKVRGIADVEARGLTVLGVLPGVIGSTASVRPAGSNRRTKRQRRAESHDRDMVVHLQPRSTVAECCRQIRTNLTFKSADRPLRTLSVTSAMPRDGKTTVSISLAITLAQSGRKVLLVDTDLRKPRLHRAFRIPAGRGITSVLAGESTLEEAIQETEVPSLSLLQCGPLPPNPSELLHTRRFAEIATEAEKLFDLVLFDSPPLGAVTDPAIIATLVEGTVLVVRERTTTRTGVDAALRQLRGVSATMIGCVLNDVDLTESAYGSYYAYYRGYYAEDADDELPPPTTPVRSEA